MSNYFDQATQMPVAIAQMCTKVLAGRELGFGPFASATGIHIIKGRPSIGANLMAAAVKSHPRYDYRVRKLTDEEVTIEFLELVDGKMAPAGISTFTKADANAAGTQNMSKYPRNMLFARAISNGVRWYCPDVFSGAAVYTPEEVGYAVDAETGEILEVAYTETPPPTAPAPKASAPPPPPGEDVQFMDDGPDGPFADAPTNRRPDWKNPQQAKAWAVQIGACANEGEAALDMRRIVDATPEGKLVAANMDAVYDAFYDVQMVAAERARQAA